MIVSDTKWPRHSKWKRRKLPRPDEGVYGRAHRWPASARAEIRTGDAATSKSWSTAPQEPPPGAELRRGHRYLHVHVHSGW